jgi:hypothetical protein
MDLEQPLRPTAVLSAGNHVAIHREDDPDTPGRQVFVLRDEQGGEIARTDSFLAEDAPARNALGRLRETLVSRGWEIVQRPNGAFGDDWWDYRFAPGAAAVDPTMLAEAVAAPGVPGLRPGRRTRRVRQRRAVKLPSVAVLVFVLFSLLMLTLTIGFVVVVLWLVSG